MDSLSRSELLLRLERAFHVSLPEQALNLTTPRELLQAVLSAGGRLSGVDRQTRLVDADISTAASSAIPQQAKTLVEVLDWHAEQQPEQTAIYLYEEDEQPLPISYAELLAGAQGVAAGLRARGLEPGQTVAIMLATERGYFFSFFGVLLAGGTPVPIYPPARPNQIEEHLRRHARILANAQCRLLITLPAAKTIARLLKAQVSTLNDIVTVEELAVSPIGWLNAVVKATDTAFLQYTSGSTGDPKGVILTHTNLLANIRAMAQRIQARSDDIFVSWLPLYHDMGLIGACLGSLYQGMPLVVMSPLRFLRRPAGWLWAIHQFRGSLSAGPNFAFELCLRNITDEDIEGLDLSSWRCAFNGAEPVSAATMRRFAERFADYGLSEKALAPVYGLAESSVGLALPAPDRGLKVDRIDRDVFASRGEAVIAKKDDAATLEMVACGHALAGHQIRIVDSNGRELPDRHEGVLQFKGPSATQGYLNNQAATEALLTGDWLDSGDRAYIADGDVYITGRLKDLIIRGGRNIYPYELELAVGEIDGVRKGCVAVFASQDKETASERLVVVAETRITEQAQQQQLQEQIRDCAMTHLGVPADDIVLVPPHAVLKTSSGKIRRNSVRELYQRDALGASSQAVWWQLIRLAIASIGPQLKRYWQAVLTYLYAGYAWLLFILFTPLVLAAILLGPNVRWRWVACHMLANGLFALLGTRLQVEGTAHLSGESQILVINHASYLDSFVAIAALPKPYRFVAKRELAANSVLKCLLERMGTLFVERFNMQRASADNEKIIQAVATGDALGFFPEGTFARTPGLLPFRIGAFLTAARTGANVIPAVLSGTRSLLRADSWFPRRHFLSVKFCEPISAEKRAEESEWELAIRLQQQAREVMLQQSGEPDLGIEDSPFAQQTLPQQN